MPEDTQTIPLMLNIPMNPISEEVAKTVNELKAMAMDLKAGIEEMKKNGFGKTSFSEQEVADELEIAPTTLAKYRRDGLISYTPVGGKARYTRENIDNFIRNNQELCKKDRNAAKKK